MSHSPKVGDLVCYSYHDCGNPFQPIRLMAIVLECHHEKNRKPYYLIQFTADSSQMTVAALELSPVDTLLSYPDTPQ